ncbi:unnamed protein product [Rotaria sp. Silwood2]|nr:unnamed protein product [Rotaria sp. Silwood2]CAF3897790.1 unnamed protein product [Rotaria sp. Silwood2]CAF4313686.1 unnamed protein product [Rotaria sp. Silwood2]
MQMASSSAAYLLPGSSSSSSIGAKTTFIKQLLPKPSQTTGSATLHSVHPQLQYPFHRSSASNQQFSRIAPHVDTLHSLTVNNTNNGTSLLTTNNNHNTNNNTSSVLTTNNGDDSGGGGGGGGGSGGHSLSQSMESINNIGLTDDEVSKKKCKKFSVDM